MEPTRITTTGASSITISGNITDVEDYMAIKKSLNELVARGGKSISILIPEAVIISSSVIGYFLKLILLDKIELSLQVKENDLYTLLQNLDLETVFKVTRMGGL